ncbi:hypothetical protein [Cytobacillus sp. IB215665]|uniref:hypothetical protein n=1 Tax=Cytobacillus sp. IB215665 TaxID=3097357 RepID=UPI002A17A97A|nr:hypothetical protein [Cytobacillus sp. IB215665]MDX8367938.1 hypothetical protein [Cytobacillus sp. IB215665]
MNSQLKITESEWTHGFITIKKKRTHRVIEHKLRKHLSRDHLECQQFVHLRKYDWREF